MLIPMPPGHRERREDQDGGPLTGMQLGRRGSAAWDVLRRGSRRQSAWSDARSALLGLNVWEFRREAQRVRLHGRRLRGLSRRDSCDLIDRVEEIRRAPRPGYSYTSRTAWVWLLATFGCTVWLLTLATVVFR